MDSRYFKNSQSVSSILVRKPILNAQLGITLIETMVACILGIFLIQGVIDVYLSNKVIFALQKAIVHIQENARFATHFLTQNIRMAGDISCEKSLTDLDSFEVIHGYQSNPPESLKNKIRKGTDSVVIKRCRFKDGKEQLEEYAFFISATSRKNRAGQIIYSLYESPVSGDKTELVSDITDMRINYGIANAQTHDVQAYLTAEQVTDWKAIKSVEIALLLSSENPVLNKDVIYKFAGELLPESRYLQKQWDIYITLREKE